MHEVRKRELREKRTKRVRRRKRETRTSFSSQLFLLSVRTLAVFPYRSWSSLLMNSPLVPSTMLFGKKRKRQEVRHCGCGSLVLQIHSAKLQDSQECICASCFTFHWYVPIHLRERGREQHLFCTETNGRVWCISVLCRPSKQHDWSSLWRTSQTQSSNRYQVRENKLAERK